LLASFYAYAPAYTGGARVAAGDVNGDGRADVITGIGPGGGPHVKVIDATRLGLVGGNAQISDAALLASFYAYAPAFTGGAYVAAGDVNGDGRADVITGIGVGGGPHVKVIDATRLGLVQGDGLIADGALLQSFYAYAAQFTGGARVGTVYANGDGRADIVTGIGPGGGPNVRVLDGPTLAELDSFYAYDTAFAGGIFVAGN
jgi:hypothetical protein